jgi:hypothetical protein
MTGPQPAAKDPNNTSRPQTRSQSKPSQPSPPAPSAHLHIEAALARRATRNSSSKETPPQPKTTPPTITLPHTRSPITSKESTPTQRESRVPASTISTTLTKGSTLDSSPQTLFPLRTIADGLQLLITTYKPTDQIRHALAEILGYTRKAAEEEAAKREAQETTVRLEDKLTKSTEQLEKAVGRLETAAAEVHTKLTTMTSTTSQLESTANSYKNALLSVPAQLSQKGEGQGNLDPAIGRSADRRSRQVLVDFPDDQMTSLSETMIKEKIIDAIKQIATPPPSKNVVIEGVTKLRNNGLVILFGSKEMADWLHNTDIDLIFTASLATGASIKPRQHLILVPRIPITLDPDNEAHLREIEEANHLTEHSISKVRWIKPENRRKPDQRLAHASFSLNSAEAANICIRDGLFVHGIKSYPNKLKQEPTQCLKCRRWGHYASQCMATKDTCGTCGGEHWTNACTHLDKRYCAPCNAHTHASWDRQCPEFLKRCAQYNESHPENALKYFPTDEPWTKVIRPPKIPFTDRFPAHFAVGSLPPPNRDSQRESPTRQIRQCRKRRTPPRATGQTAITNFYGPSGSQTRSDYSDPIPREDGEVDEPPMASPFSFDGTHLDNPTTWI